MFLILALAVVVEAQSNFILNILTYLFAPLLNWIIHATCQAIFNNFDDGFRLGCRCRGIYDDLMGGIGGKITCQIDDPFCLINRPFKVYCGELSLTATFNTRQGIANIKGCIDITSDFPKDFPIPIDDVSQFPRLCVSAVPSNMDFLTFQSCEIKFDRDVCSSCIVCPSGRDFLFDCRNVNVNPAQDVEPTFIEGPFVTECVGFSFLFGSTTQAPTFAPAVAVSPTAQPVGPPVAAPAQVPKSTNVTVPVSNTTTGAPVPAP